MNTRSILSVTSSLACSLAQLHAAAFISGRPVYVQRNGLANTRLKYAMKFNSFVRKSTTDVNDPRRITFRMITPNTTSIWFSHEPKPRRRPHPGQCPDLEYECARGGSGGRSWRDRVRSSGLVPEGRVLPRALVRC